MLAIIGDDLNKLYELPYYNGVFSKTAKACAVLVGCWDIAVLLLKATQTFLSEFRKLSIKAASNLLSTEKVKLCQIKLRREETMLFRAASKTDNCGVVIY